MTGTPPNIQHWEHFHGFPDLTESQCATGANDANNDGFVDLVETEVAMGTTMVPFNDAPHRMDIPTDTYPVSDASGSYEYSMTVPLAELQERFGETYDGTTISLDRRVFMVHGMPDDFEILDSVAGQVGPYGTHVTLPIACGKIVKTAG